MTESQRIKKLEEENARLRAELDRLRQNLHSEAEAALSSEPLVKLRNAGAPKQTLRDWVLETLAEAGTPLYSQYLSNLHYCRFDRTLQPARFGTLSADERKRVEAGRTPPTVLVHGLVASSGTAIKRVWARSDWPLSERLIADKTGRVLYLRTALWIFREAAGSGEGWAQFTGLKLLATQLARDLPVDIRRKPEDFVAWAERAEAELAEIEDDDRAARREAAERLETLNSLEKWFGANAPLTVLPGTEEQAWKGSNS